MAKTTGIAWCDSTFNPWRICTPIGPGCDNCYAAALGHRFGLEYKQGVPRIRTSESYWKQPLAWNKKAAASGKPWRVFCASLADVFDNEVPDEWRHDLWRLIDATPHLDWLIVTKRIGNAERMLPPTWINRAFPVDNVRILITVCNQEEADRDIPKLLALPCKNGISYEPALGSVDFRAWLPWKTRAYEGNPSIQWIIVGGESGSKARPFDLAWARSTVAQCKAAGVPVFVKQLGRYPMPESDDLCGHRSKGHSFYRGWPLRYCDEDENVSVDLKDRTGADPTEWPEDLRVREFPK